MPEFKKRIETGLEQFAYFIYRNRFITLLIMLMILVFLAANATRLHSNTSIEGLLHDEDPILLDYNTFRDQFGREELIVIAIKTPDIFNMAFLERLKALHDELSDKVPLTEKISSLINARHTYGNQDELIVRDLFDPWPTSLTDLEIIKKRVLGTPAYLHTLISEDGTYTTLLIQTRQFGQSGEPDVAMDGFQDTRESMNEQHENAKSAPYLTDEENSMIVEAVNGIIKKYDAPDFKIFLAGSPSVTHALKIALLRDMTFFTTLSIIAISIFLFFMFRRVSGVIIPLVIVVFSLVSTFGTMALSHAVIKTPFTVLPSFLLTVGVGDSVHVLVYFFRFFNKTGDKEKAIAHALSHCGLAIILTSITTAGGLLSFVTAEIAPVADLGLFAAIGVMLALLYTIILLPTLLAIFPMKVKTVTREQTMPHISERILKGIGNIATNRAGGVIVISTIILIVSIAGITKIRFFHNIVQWFPENDPIRISTETIDRDLKGSISLEVVVDAGKENGIYDPLFLKKLDETAQKLETYASGDLFVGKAWSITTILKEINKALHGNNDEYYTLPETRELTAQELLLFESSGSEDMADFTDSQYEKARLIIKVPAIDAMQYSEFINLVSDHLKKVFPDEKITTTGMMAILFKTIHNLIKSMVKSYVIALVVTTILMILLIGRIRLGLLSMIPNIFPIVVMLGLMGWLSIPMDMFSILVGSIAIGIVVDDTVHFMHNFKRFSDQTGDVKQAILKTLLNTGPAMLVTSLVLSTGFFMFMFSSMTNLFNFGLLTGITILIALLADFLLGPALLAMAGKKF
ncbi:MAG: MMPL family transporter [Proteobacteria bacterium]|nr:MMPL family transporter [Pseudomonadota bacterium]